MTTQQLATWLLGETPDQVTSQINQAKSNAASLTTLASQGDEQTGLLQDISDVLSGKHAKLRPDVTLIAPSGSPSAAAGAQALKGRNLNGATSGPVATSSPDVVAAVRENTAAVVENTYVSGTRS